MNIDLGSRRMSGMGQRGKIRTAEIEVEESRQRKASFPSLMDLLGKFGKAYANFSVYECDAAIELFHQLPSNHQITGWVLKYIGRCHFECMRYEEGQKYF